ncbi:hypothetical protein [Halopenitus persicus]|nr:hypothetical protein [Halopenitus persicus]
MSVSQPIDKIWRNPIGRLLCVLGGMSLAAGMLTLYPQLLPVAKWSVPVCLVLWGITRFYLYGVEDMLTSAAGCLLILGGFSYASYLFTPMSELNGTVAQLIPVTGIFVELFAAHYRNQE